MQHITATAFIAYLESGRQFQLVDVREAAEHDAFNIGGELIPLSELFEHANKIAFDKPVIIYCKMGIRSQIAIQRLEERFGYTNLINLQGGLESWKKLK
jgi:rhodanese-related sulfurtransferase